MSRPRIVIRDSTWHHSTFALELGLDATVFYQNLASLPTVPCCKWNKWLKGHETKQQTNCGGTSAGISSLSNSSSLKIMVKLFPFCHATKKDTEKEKKRWHSFLFQSCLAIELSCFQALINSLYHFPPNDPNWLKTITTQKCNTGLWPSTHSQSWLILHCAQLKTCTQFLGLMVSIEFKDDITFPILFFLSLSLSILHSFFKKSECTKTAASPNGCFSNLHVLQTHFKERKKSADIFCSL